MERGTIAPREDSQKQEVQAGLARRGPDKGESAPYEGEALRASPHRGRATERAPRAPRSPLYTYMCGSILTTQERSSRALLLAQN